MNEDAKYKFGSSFLTRADLLRQVGDRVKDMDQVTAKAYISLVSKQLDFDMEQEKSLYETRLEQDRFRTRTMPSIGLILVILMLGWAYFFPFPSNFQGGIFWIAFCLFVALAFFLVMGYFNIEHKVGEIAVKAGGPMGIFFMMYFFPPHVMNQQTERKKIDIMIMRNDTASVRKISADFNPLEQTTISSFITQTVKDYYGPAIIDTFTCFRTSDGKIIDLEKCSSIGNESIVAISLSAIRNFNNPNEAFTHCLKKSAN